jgi:ABC-type uncharacterized transport system substrate-binding protein
MRRWTRLASAIFALAVPAALPSPDTVLAQSRSAGPAGQELPGIGLLLYGSLSTARNQVEGEHPFFVGLREVGLVDGKNAAVIVRKANGHVDRLPPLAAELVAAKPDVIVTAGPQPIQAVKDATKTIPIVMAIVSDPVTYGFVTSLAHPGGNLTGLSMVNTELSSKRVELLKEAAPGITRVAVFTDPTMGSQGLPETKAAAHALGLELQVISIAGAELERGFAAAEQGRAQALLVMPTPFYNLPAVRQRIGQLALQHRLPSMCEEISFVRDGCLLSYGPDFAAMWRRSAVFVDKILKGAKPADLPVEQPTKFDLFINGKTADALGLTIPPMLRTLADEVIE